MGESCGRSGRVHCLITPAELLKMKITNSLWNLPDVLGISDIKEIVFGGLLFSSTLRTIFSNLVGVSLIK